MKQNDAFPSNYLKAEDFAEGEEKELVISKLTLEEMTARDQSKENKPVLHFKDFWQTDRRQCHELEAHRTGDRTGRLRQLGGEESHPLY